MTVENKVKAILGEQTLTIAILQQKIEELELKVKELTPQEDNKKKKD